MAKKQEEQGVVRTSITVKKGGSVTVKKGQARAEAQADEKGKPSEVKSNVSES